MGEVEAQHWLGSCAASNVPCKKRTGPAKRWGCLTRAGKLHRGLRFGTCQRHMSRRLCYLSHTRCLQPEITRLDGICSIALGDADGAHVQGSQAKHAKIASHEGTHRYRR